MIKKISIIDLKILQIVKDAPKTINQIIEELEKAGIKMPYSSLWKRIVRLRKLGLIRRGEIESRIEDVKHTIILYKLNTKYRKWVESMIDSINDVTSPDREYTEVME